jgi:ABC-type branched-subunit amino acid transport system ATPase component
MLVLGRALMGKPQVLLLDEPSLGLAMALASKPKFLLLDEPMAGMSPQESAVVVKLLKKLKQSYGILLIEHDMDAVFALGVSSPARIRFGRKSE